MALIEEKQILDTLAISPFNTQLIKWVGNKQRFAHEIISYFPANFGTYYEVFLGSGAVLATLSPKKGLGSDIFEPLIGIWKTLKTDPAQLKKWYKERWSLIAEIGKNEAYEYIKKSYNHVPNSADFLFITRSCYGGVVRFRKEDGYISTPCGIHDPISPQSFASRVDIWYQRTKNTEFKNLDYQEVFNMAQPGDMIYCDPPYNDSQAILYGAQAFVFDDLIESIADAKKRGIFVALSINGTKKSGSHICNDNYPQNLFERKLTVNCGRSMLKRFQMQGKSLEDHEVTDRLMLTY